MQVKEALINIEPKSQFKFFTRILNNNHKKWLIVTHGIGEHSGRYDFIFELFKSEYNIFAYDLRGHGKTDGRRAYVDKFTDFRHDLNQVLIYLKKEYGLKDFVLYGHSMGALITADYMQNHSLLPNSYLSQTSYPDKVFLSSPPALASGLIAKLISFLPFKVIENFACARVGFYLKSTLELSALSHDEDICKAYAEDKLIHEKYHSHLLFGLLARAKDVFSRSLGISSPTYLTVGNEDEIVSPQAIDHFMRKFGDGVEYKVFQDGRHELHNEIDEIRLPYFEFLKNSLL